MYIYINNDTNNVIKYSIDSLQFLHKYELKRANKGLWKVMISCLRSYDGLGGGPGVFAGLLSVFGVFHGLALQELETPVVVLVVVSECSS